MIFKVLVRLLDPDSFFYGRESEDMARDGYRYRKMEDEVALCAELGEKVQILRSLNQREWPEGISLSMVGQYQEGSPCER